MTDEWKALDAKGKEPYDAMSEVEKKRYAEEMDAYRAQKKIEEEEYKIE